MKDSVKIIVIFFLLFCESCDNSIFSKFILRTSERVEQNMRDSLFNYLSDYGNLQKNNITKKDLSILSTLGEYSGKISEYFTIFDQINFDNILAVKPSYNAILDSINGLNADIESINKYDSLFNKTVNSFRNQIDPKGVYISLEQSKSRDSILYVMQKKFEERRIKENISGLRERIAQLKTEMKKDILNLYYQLQIRNNP